MTGIAAGTQNLSQLPRSHRSDRRNAGNFGLAARDQHGFEPMTLFFTRRTVSYLGLLLAGLLAASPAAAGSAATAPEIGRAHV